MANVEPLIAGKRCLVLDDEFLIALDIQGILESAGAATVTCVGNATEALAALRGGTRFDFAVLDIKLSGVMRNSLSVAAVLSEQGIPFVFLTGVRRDEARMQQFPNAPVVEKPYEAPLLVAAILRLLAGR